MIQYRDDGLSKGDTFSMGRELRRQAMRDFPILGKVAALLRSPSGRRMDRWDKLALPIELLLLGHGAALVAKTCGMCRKTVCRLRERLIAGGFLNSRCECGNRINHTGRCWARLKRPMPRYRYAEKRRRDRAAAACP